MTMQRYSRQMQFKKIGSEGQEKLLAAKVAIVGIGALGTVIANNLCRAGVGYLRLIDRDYVELSNLQRQTLFTEADAHQQTPKAVAAGKQLQAVNSEITLEPVVADVNPANVEKLIADVDLVVDGSDNFEVRYLVNEACVKTKTPWIYGGAIMSTGASLNILPGETPCLRCVYPHAPAPGSYPTCSTAGVINMITGITASIESAEAIKILIGSPDVRQTMVTIDLWHNFTDYLDIKRSPDCPVCAHHQYERLGQSTGSYTTSLCGRDSIQVVPGTSVTLDLEAIAAKLKQAGRVKYNRFMLRFSDDKIEFNLFPDGRAIIKNVKDESVAKSVYAEYIGL
ncbi:MAG: thiazole biosynthesis adenylyltransferase ThiF [Firmicutes bacterium]|nr:thiazole biosynthesis adenylyltransferase ThiF [Bacillota bacterium]